MPVSWQPRGEDRVDYVVVERDGVDGQREAVGIEIGNPTPTVRRRFRRSLAKRQMPAPTPTPTPMDDDSDDDSDLEDALESLMPSSRPFTIPSATPTGVSSQPVSTTLPGNRPIETPARKGPAPTETTPSALLSGPGSISNDPSSDRQGGISQTTEHLLIAAGSIGATIVIVMIILAFYTMRKRGLTISDVIQNSKASLRQRGGPPPPPKYGMDTKKSFDDYTYAGNDVYPPGRAATNSRSGSLGTLKPLQALGRSDSFNQMGLNKSNANNQSFILDPAPPSRQNSHRRDISDTPSSPVLPIQSMRRSESTHNTRSLRDEEEALDYYETMPHQQSAVPAPPTFRQFLSNRPSASQRPGLGGGMASRFSWTNSNAPQTPHDPSRDTAIAGPGRDSFMTQRSSVPRFRTIDSWVNQQSTRVEEQKLKQQFRMTQSTTYSDEDSVPEMPRVPSTLSKEVKHARHDTIDTAPIFKQHPGTEVRFSTRSTVPSEVLETRVRL
ncbi:hypothetical protein HBH56_113110 [Parastagonospora nodorum]|uniref:Uncharacterized protein n=1 Tax=Phaeosphaeria nodorum (strain SN15 / ATCC MYA-4574 / FGSC 10173) TaxID=321614 RepID=A0A7U2FE17_PHANO|nr:hypothetical protein HBH56_113110 [Parastagonospora nodorum]QRD03552.1 hypothetical protein JI435_103190 [Parastagonospora nodorum SN15]KAH3921522.1 hypothetical protein HBH54_239360 [Parastagonospora nodorum]KAH3951029.1 hypothetical protein HBH53_068770 [Parastagonospora nodorum]KAH3962964.1 hypothetical protein HBH51_169440 [Parastagonospora nodorum]